MKSQNPRVLIAGFVGLFGSMSSLAARQVPVHETPTLLQWNHFARITLALDELVEAGRFADLAQKSLLSAVTAVELVRTELEWLWFVSFDGLRQAGRYTDRNADHKQQLLHFSFTKPT